MNASKEIYAMLLPSRKPLDDGGITNRALPFATPAAACLLLSVLTTCQFLSAQLNPAISADVGQIPPNVAPNVREWFRDARSPRSGNVHCCDIADGHIVPYRADDNGVIWVTILGAEYEVPGDAIVPPPYVLLEGVVWYRLENGKPWIRCFAPGGGL